MNGNRIWRKLVAVVFVAVLAGVALAPAPAGAGRGNPGIVPPAESAYGHTYGEWSNMWWQWVTDIPIDPDNLAAHPMFDQDGVNCGVGQAGEVWFLAGNQYSGPLTRKCTVPADTALFVPLINIEEDASHYTNPHSRATRQAVDTYVADMVALMRTEPEYMWATIDGEPVADVSSYLVPADNAPYVIQVRDFAPPLLNLEQYWYGAVPAGDYYARSAGYYLLINPFPAGPHTIHFVAAAGDPVFFTLDVTYKLTVER